MTFFHKPPEPLKLTSPATLIATFFGSGLLKPASGTWGSLAALYPGFLIAQYLGGLGLLLAAGIAYGLGHWASTQWISHSVEQDPSPIVIDEVVGIWLTLIAIAAPLNSDTLTIENAALAFVLFRFFDIVKPWPISWADRSLRGAKGVMVDDVFAGVMAGLLLFALHYNFH